jgi:CRISPR-associated protein Csc1
VGRRPGVAVPVLDWGQLPYDLYHVRLILHDYLWFSSFDSGATSTTVPILHNYALGYAINRYERGITFSSVPTYEQDLKEFAIYPTPGRANSAVRQVITYNAVDEMTQRTDSDQEHNTPMLGRRRVVLPYEGGNSTVSSAGRYASFEFFAFASRGALLPRIVRIGKKRCPAALEARLLDNVTLWFGSGTPDHAINPLDVRGALRRFVPISVPPSLLLDAAHIEDDWFLRAGTAGVVHVPARLSVGWAPS